MVFRVMSKFELRRIAKSIGATPLVRLGAPTKEEIGFADRVYVDEISSMKCIVIVRESEENKLATIITRGSTMNYLENIERIIEDGVNVYRNTCKDPNFVPGAGAIEMFLSNGIKNYGKTITILDQYCIKKFGEAFEVIPTRLKENLGLNVNEKLANLNT
jgi:T-complex protein 1 subunit theta